MIFFLSQDFLTDFLLRGLVTGALLRKDMTPTGRMSDVGTIALTVGNRCPLARRSYLNLMKLLFSLVILAAGSTWAATNNYQLDMQLAVDGKVISEPQIIVAEGEPGSVTSSDGKEQIHFDVLVKEGEWSGHKGILVKLKIDKIASDGTRNNLSQPQMLLDDGKEGLIEVVSSDREVALKVTANRTHF